MSVRVYSGPHAGRGRSRSGSWRRLVPGVLVVATIGMQICWPLTDGATRDLLTALTVVAFFLATLSHALLVRGFAWALGWVLIAGGIGLAAEVIGVRTGLPFGDYTYADRLGPAVFGVPVVIALAWAMMSYPCLLAARRLARRPVPTALLAAVLLASWDLFLDPQMVHAGHWTWASSDPSLPGIPGVPMQNFAGWLLVALLLMAVLDRLPRGVDDGAVPPDGVPAVLLTWTYLSSVLLNLAFAQRPGVALWGGVVMGAILLPYLARARTGRH